MFISFTAICVWFQLPYCAKQVAPNWIFEAHNNQDTYAARRKWELFRPNFERDILGNLSSYFNCPAIKGFLTEMRDKCFAPTWGDDDRIILPSGYKWPDNVPRVTHDDMLGAVERAIISLFKEGDQDRLYQQKIPDRWTDAHAHITDDGIFVPPPTMSSTFPPVVVDGANASKGLVTSGIFDRVRPVQPDLHSAPTYSRSIVDATAATSSHNSAVRSSQRALYNELFQPGRVAKRPPPVAADSYFRGGGKTRRLQ